MVDTDDTRQKSDDRRRTMPDVWHKLFNGELKNACTVIGCVIIFVNTKYLCRATVNLLH